MDKVCFRRDTFNTYMFICVLVIVYVMYILKHSPKESFTEINTNNGLSYVQLQDRLAKLQDRLYYSQIDNQICKRDLSSCKISNINKISESGDGKLTPPNRIYNTNTTSYQQLGYIYKDNERYPLYGVPKYPGRSDKWEYYVIDETRNRLKIPFRSTNDNELTDYDTLDIISLGSGYSVKIYDYQEFKYNPNL